jgi:hypothetical protein
MSEDKEVLLEKVRELETRPGRTVDSWADDANNTASILKERRRLSEPLSDEGQASRRLFIRSLSGFLVGGVAAATGFLGWRWMSVETKTALLRRSLEFNERVSQIFFRPARLAPEFRPDQITEARVNGLGGMTGEFDPLRWTLAVGGLYGRTDLSTGRAPVFPILQSAICPKRITAVCPTWWGDHRTSFRTFR